MSEGAEHSRQHARKIQIDDEHLIELVRINRVLYDASHCKYANPSYRDRTWLKIGKELRQPASVCKKRWFNIRDNYKKTLRRHVDGVNPFPKRYKYSDRLEFLRCLLENREESASSDQISVKPEIISDDSAETEIFEPVVVQADPKTTEHDPASCDQEIVHNSAETKTESVGSLFRIMLERMETRAENMHGHPVDMFLSGIAPTLKSLTPYYLSLAKAKIYSVVQEYEMAMIMAQRKGSDKM